MRPPIGGSSRAGVPVFRPIPGESGQLSVGVIVDLFQSPSAGGHVKTWEKLADAACGEPLDLTVYFFGAKDERACRWRRMCATSTSHRCGAPSRCRFWRASPRTPTSRHCIRARCGACAGTTSCMPPTPTFLWRAPRGCFRAGLRARWFIPRTPIRRATRACTRIRFCAACAAKAGWAARCASAGTCRTGWAGACSGVWIAIFAAVTGPGRRMNNACGSLRSAIRPERMSLLRRGIDTELFHPARRDRARLEQTVGHSAGPRGAAVCRARRRRQGRSDAGACRAHAARPRPACACDLRRRGRPDAGGARPAGRASLAARTSVAGRAGLALRQRRPVCLLLADRGFSQRHLEAKASGLPVVVSAQGGSAKLVRHSAPATMPTEWPSPATNRTTGPARSKCCCARRSAAAPWEKRRAASWRTTWPSWRQVLREDLLPVWQFVARERGLLA